MWSLFVTIGCFKKNMRNTHDTLLAYLQETGPLPMNVSVGAVEHLMRSGMLLPELAKSTRHQAIA